MKRKLFLLLLQAATFFANAQNVGIGTSTPQTKLHIVSPTDEVLRLDANYPFVSLYTGGVYKGYFWKGPASIELGSATGSNLPITFAPNGNQLMYVGINGNVGIGTTAPLGRLHISNGASGNITPFSPLVVEGNNNTYINLLSPNSNETGILFGKASDASSGGIVYNNVGSLNGFQFRTWGNQTRMVLDQNGYVGIGNADPSFLLDVNNRIRIRSGGDLSNTAGIWLNKTDNSALQSFIGIENDNYVGFYGLTAGWKFSMNTQTGALKINGTEGQAGQVLQSNGNSAASWSSATNTLYNNTAIVYGTASSAQTFPANIPDLPILGLSYTFTVSGNVKVMVSFNVPPHTNGCSGCNPSHISIKMKLNNNHIATYWEYLPASTSSNMSSTHLLQVGPGTYTIQLFGEATEQDFFMFGNSIFRSNYMIVQVISQ